MKKSHSSYACFWGENCNIAWRTRERAPILLEEGCYMLNGPVVQRTSLRHTASELGSLGGGWAGVEECSIPHSVSCPSYLSWLSAHNLPFLSSFGLCKFQRVLSACFEASVWSHGNPFASAWQWTHTMHDELFGFCFASQPSQWLAIQWSYTKASCSEPRASSPFAHA